jgi:hypothetical protein
MKRITNADGADVLPAFSHDGKQLFIVVSQLRDCAHKVLLLHFQLLRGKRIGLVEGDDLALVSEAMAVSLEFSAAAEYFRLRARQHR